jgi:hypothetical protein
MRNNNDHKEQGRTKFATWRKVKSPDLEERLGRQESWAKSPE